MVLIEMICDCECTKYREMNSTKCNKAGAYTCGSCNCNKGRYGYACQCNSNDFLSKNVQTCKENSVTNLVCSGLGTCVCGSCQCFVREVRKID